MKRFPHWSIRPRWRVTRGTTIALGPGKADLLAAIAKTGSISAAAASLRMSYRRAWMLVRTMNACFRTPVVSTSAWRGQGASLTPTGQRVLRLYRKLEADSTAAVRRCTSQLARLLASPPKVSQRGREGTVARRRTAVRKRR